MTALHGAFNLKAETIWLLTDGVFFNTDSLINEIRAANARVKSRINTVSFIDRRGEKVLQQIAKENGGTYSFVQN